MYYAGITLPYIKKATLSFLILVITWDLLLHCTMDVMIPLPMAEKESNTFFFDSCNQLGLVVALYHGCYDAFPPPMAAHLSYTG